MEIKLFKSDKKLNKFLLKTILKETKYNNHLSLGVGYENEMIPFFKIISEFKKIKWDNIKIVSLIEYFDHQSTMFYSLLQNEFISKLNNFNEKNFLTKIDDIKNLKDSHNLNDLYINKIDLGILYLDFRGNFLLNDYESKCNFIHISTNGDKIISPGLKSILLSFKKLIIIGNNVKSERVLNKLISKKIDENEPFTFLNFHKNSILLTLTSLISKRNIVDSIESGDFEKWSKKIFKDNEASEINDDINKIVGDKFIDDSLEDMSKNSESSLDDELENALRIINEEKQEIAAENSDINLEDENAFDPINTYPEIVDNSFINNLNDTFANDSNYLDDDLYGNNFEEENLFSDNDALNDVQDKNIKTTEDVNMECLPLDNVDTQKNDASVNNWLKDDGVPVSYIKNDNKTMSTLLDKGNNLNTKFPNRLNNFHTQKTPQFIKHVNKEIVKPIKPLNMDEINYLKNIIKIKEDTLSSIELLQKSLDTPSRSNYIKNVTPNQASVIRDNVNDFDLKFVYIPGMRPTPMLAVYDIPNLEVYNNTYTSMKDSLDNIDIESNYSDSFKHFWNHGAYIIFDETNLEIKSLLFSDFSLFIFLLRFINKSLWFCVPKIMQTILQNELKIFIDEFTLVKK